MLTWLHLTLYATMTVLYTLDQKSAHYNRSFWFTDVNFAPPLLRSYRMKIWHAATSCNMLVNISACCPSGTTRRFVRFNARHIEISITLASATNEFKISFLSIMDALPIYIVKAPTYSYSINTLG